MSKENPANGCLECEAWDEKTRELMAQLFHREEVANIALLIASNMSVRHRNLKSLKSKMTMMQRIQERKALDQMAATFSKFMITFDDKYVQVLEQTMAKVGVSMRMEHEPCKHKFLKKPGEAPISDIGGEP